MIAFRAVSARYQAIDQEASDDFRKDFKNRAYALLDNWVFPASASTPVQSPVFVGGGSITVTVFDDWTRDSRWMVRCIAAGGAGAVFEVYRSRDEVNFTYDLGSMTQFPDDSTVDSGSPTGLVTEIRITVTASGDNFAVGDFWTFRTFSKWRRDTVQGPTSTSYVRTY